MLRVLEIQSCNVSAKLEGFGDTFADLVECFTRMGALIDREGVWKSMGDLSMPETFPVLLSCAKPFFVCPVKSGPATGGGNELKAL